MTVESSSLLDLKDKPQTHARRVFLMVFNDRSYELIGEQILKKVKS
jgi:hypothetical protein